MTTLRFAILAAVAWLLLFLLALALIVFASAGPQVPGDASQHTPAGVAPGAGR